LFNVPRVSFYGFLMAIAKSDAINEHIGLILLFYIFNFYVIKVKSFIKKMLVIELANVGTQLSVN
jgi:hypothetical protein